MNHAMRLWHTWNMRNFHLPLSDDTYEHLKAAAERSKVPATAIAREAIDFWLRQQLRKVRHDAIAAYAAEAAGTDLDLDAKLEAASIEHLMTTARESK
jgi:predicted transcriptional regulator